jgi:two-component system sensor histidine kinase YesM
MRSLRSVIFRRILIIAVVSFLLSAGFTYYYYQMILVKQMLKDDNTKLQQTTQQLQYMSDDIANFSFSLIISDQLQNFYRNYEKKDTFDQFALLSDTINFLNNNKGLRKEVTSFSLVLPDGSVFWSESKYDDYFQEIMKESWYKKYADYSGPHTFTEPHDMLLNGSATSVTKIISFIVKVKDIQSTGVTIGELILNLDYRSFESLLTFASDNFDRFLWINDADHVFYRHSQSSEKDDSYDFLLQAASSHFKKVISSSTSSIPGGFMIMNQMSSNNWRLLAFTSHDTLIHKAKFIIYLLAVFSTTSTVLILLLMMPVIFRITKPIIRLYYAMNAVSDGNLQTSVSIQTGDELERLGLGFNRMTDQLRVHLESSIRYEKEKREMELELLLSQLNPHFVYNTLNAVIYMAQKQANQDIVLMVGSFIRILQDAAKLGNANTLIPLSNEIGMLKEYAVIQSYRYLEMFAFICELDDRTLNCLVPRYLIQPFVENAIFHGICPKDEKGIIRVTSTVHEEQQLKITIEDDGVGIEEDLLAFIWEKGDHTQSSGLRHIGMSNTKKRLDHLFGGMATIDIESKLGQGTTVTILLPLQDQVVS